MSIGAIILLILLGFILLLVEFFILPGITIAGIGGFLCLIGGVIAAYHSKGMAVGNLVMLITTLSSFGIFFFVLRGKTWSRVGLANEIDGKVETVDENIVHVGDVAKTITRLNPIGKIMANNFVFEAKAHSGFIDENREVEVIKILKTQIIVKLK